MDFRNSIQLGFRINTKYLLLTGSVLPHWYIYFLLVAFFLSNKSIPRWGIYTSGLNVFLTIKPMPNY